MKADLEAIRGDNEISIVIRRGSSTLEAQPVRIARAGRAGGEERQNQRVEEHRLRMTMLGGADFDVQVDDRFTHDGVLCRVGFVHPNRRVAVTADAEAVE